MEYTLVQVVHLLCAIIFVGFIFADIFIFPAVKKKFGQDTYDNMMSAIVGRGIIIYPLIVITLIASGGYMFTKYINSFLNLRPFRFHHELARPKSMLGKEDHQ